MCRVNWIQLHDLMLYIVVYCSPLQVVCVWFVLCCRCRGLCCLLPLYVVVMILLVHAMIWYHKCFMPAFIIIHIIDNYVYMYIFFYKCLRIFVCKHRHAWWWMVLFFVMQQDKTLHDNNPTGFTADGSVENFKRRRQTELKHGRISMLATMGYITPATWLLRVFFFSVPFLLTFSFI